MRTFALGAALVSVVSLAAGCASGESNARGAVAGSSANEAATSTGVTGITGATVTLTSARSESSRPSFLAHTSSRATVDSADGELRQTAAMKARCEASDDDACAEIARGRLR